MKGGLSFVLIQATNTYRIVSWSKCVMQKGKGKAAAAAASQASQPQLASQAMESEDTSPLEHDIAVTTELLERFNAYADAWEALEVIYCRCLRQPSSLPWKC